MGVRDRALKLYLALLSLYSGFLPILILILCHFSCCIIFVCEKTVKFLIFWCVCKQGGGGGGIQNQCPCIVLLLFH